MLTSSFNRFEQPEQRQATAKWPFTFSAEINSIRPDNELSRRIKWPTDLNSLGIDSTDAFRPVRRLIVPFHFPGPSTRSKFSAPTTIENTSTAIGDKNHNSNETAIIGSNVIDIVANTDTANNNNNNVSSAPSDTLQRIPNEYQPQIFIDENDTFQIKYVRRDCVAKNNATESIQMFPMNVSPIANNGSQQHTNTTSSIIITDIDEAAINSYDDQQFELDVRFDGLNESITDSNRDSNITNTTNRTNNKNNDIYVKTLKKDQKQNPASKSAQTK